MARRDPPDTPDRGRLARGALRRRRAIDDTLIGELRSAFSDHRDVLAEPSSCWLGSGEPAGTAGNGHAAGDALPPGTRLDGFEIAGEIGRGGMGVVYRAHQPALHRDVALKVLPETRRAGAVAGKRFLSESCAAARVHHANVIAIHARGTYRDRLYYAMELVEGSSLDRVIRAEPSWFARDFRRLAARFADLADGLAAVHAAGVVHRDIKPHNILVGPAGRLVLTDFGVARLADAPELTGEGDLLGTPAYLAPEQIASEGSVDERTDVYALGLVLYEVLTGRRPYRGDRREQTAQRILKGAPVPPRRVAPDVPPALEAICLRAMDRTPARRYATAAALTDELRRFAAGQPIATRTPGPVRRALRVAAAHRARTLAITALIVLVAVSAGWMATTAAARQREGAHRLASAWEALAFVDYKRGDELAGDLRRAAELGARGDAIEMARALADLGAERTPAALGRLRAMKERGADDPRLDYLLAWALWRTGETGASRAVRDAADDAGGPATPEGWFFRGLAVHFDDADDAVRSYRTAIADRAAALAFYPQAALHLARAHNQRMYASRSVEPFGEAEAALRRLADHGVYGAYPHYLLSVAHRLAAEIADEPESPRDARRERHLEDALAWARSGQALEPDSHHPLTAEAECLEAMGAHAEAEAARTRAIAAAPSSRAIWEGHHYRWRLRYWLGDLDGALADLRRCAEFDPDDRFYAKVYPALVLADLGRRDEAAALARALAEPGAPADVAWAVTTLRLVGRADEARDLLAARGGPGGHPTRPDPAVDPWWRDLLTQLADGGRLDVLEARAAEADTPWTLWSEAAFHDAARRLAAGDRDGARNGFRRAYRSFDGERRYTYHGKVMWRRLAARPWPTTHDDSAEGKE